jgi:hypothetical protein
VIFPMYDCLNVDGSDFDVVVPPKLNCGLLRTSIAPDISTAA